MNKTKLTNNETEKNKLSVNNKRISNQKGITLIALVITIVILIILATISINFIFNGGLIDRAEQARDFYQNDEAYTDKSVSNLTGYIDGWINGIEGGTGGSGSGDGVQKISDVKTPLGEDVVPFTDPVTDLEDDYGNIVKVPAGFGIASDSGTKVEEGIVIEDADGNQFVWIPVGNYTATAITQQSTLSTNSVARATTTTKINNLARREWGNRNAVIEPTEIIADNGDGAINGVYYGEGNENSCTNNEDGTNSIDAFKSSATQNGGFYIGRYEAGTETDRTAETDPLTTPLVQANKFAYVYVTRDQAKTQAEAMYKDKAEVNATSQLISGYAWDTALNFICQNSEHGYLLATTTDSIYGNIDTDEKKLTGEYSADNYSNIHDLLGNCKEWITEYSTEMASTQRTYTVQIGGNVSDGYAGDRLGQFLNSSVYNTSFRIQLFINQN